MIHYFHFLFKLFFFIQQHFELGYFYKVREDGEIEKDDRERKRKNEEREEEKMHFENGG